MIFQERKKEKGYNYICQDVFGEVEIDSPEKLESDTLDAMISLLLKNKATSKTVTGEVKSEKGIVEYKFVKADMWSDDDEKNICENTHASTRKPAREYTAIGLSIKRAMSWLQRFVGAFREAWKRAKL